MNPSKRRDDTAAALPSPKRARKACAYGESCYRRNPAHLREYSHPHLESILDSYSGSGDYPIPENLSMQRQMIDDQLQIMLEKNIYNPQNNTTNSVASCQVKDTAVVASKPSTSDASSKNKELDTKVSIKVNEVDVETPGKVGKKEEVTESVRGRSPELKEVGRKTLQAAENKMASSSKETGDPLGFSDYRPVVVPTRRIGEFFKVVAPPGRAAEKHRRAAPYHIFYTTITAAEGTHGQPNSITFQEILDRSLGELRCSLQINFMVDIGWLLAQYYFAGYSKKRLTVLYGEETPDIRGIGEKHRNVDAHLVAMATPFGKHHTKMMILCYEDGSLRVVVSTANLYVDDWENRTQGLWMSPACGELPAGAMPHDGDSPTGFKRSLLGYLEHYRSPRLAHYVERVRRCDMSHINVFLVASVPGSHTDTSWGMNRVGALLQRHCAVPPADAHRWELIAQASSIGSYGKEPRLWLTGDFHSKFCRARDQSALLSSAPPKLRLIYPSLENVQQSHDGLLGGGCLPYAASVHTKQTWLKDFLHQWSARGSGRQRAMPHIKSYLRASPDYKTAAYYLLTSANVSKAAWGVVNKGNAALRIMSYEAGVLFLPRFVINEDFFPLDQKERNCLPTVYDLPPTPYTSSMGPWVMDYLHD